SLTSTDGGPPMAPITANAVTSTVTVAEALAQGAVPTTVEVYTPGEVVPGMNTPFIRSEEGAGPGHTPPICGQPPRGGTRQTGAGGLLVNMGPSAPALGPAGCVTLTKATAAGQG